MIKNKKQHTITKTNIDNFQKTLSKMREKTDQVSKLERDSIQSMVNDLQGQIDEFDILKLGVIPELNRSYVSELPKTLIQSRIALDMTQKNLADKLGIHAQQIQKYEQTDYMSASYSRILDVFNVLVFESDKRHTR